MKKKTWAIVLSVVLVLALAITGTIAYLTDRDSDANVFTWGNVDITLNEEFEQGAVLTPGVKIEKVPTITNTGKNDAWVWMTVAIPSALDNFSADGEVGSNENVIHWNCTGATWEGSVAQNYVDSAIEKGLLPAGTTAEAILAANTTWNVNNKVAPYQETINGVDCNVYTLLYNKAIAPGEATLPSLTQMYMDAMVDIDPDGNLAKIVNGVATPIDWNINTDGNPVVYVSAYATQVEGFATVVEAHAAYAKQWGNNGTEYAEQTTIIEINDAEELKDAIANAGSAPIVLKLANGEYLTNLKVPAGKDITITGSKNVVLEGQIAATSSGTLTIKGVTVNVSNKIVDSTGISQTGKSGIAIWGEQTVICNNVTFNMSLNDATAITSWWDTGKGTSIVVKDCVFNCNGQRPIRATGNVTVEGTDFNDPYRYAVQLTAKASTATLLDKAIINFNDNTIVNGESGKAFVYGLQLEGSDYGCHDLVINGTGNTIVDGGTESVMYYCECGKVDHATVEWNVEVSPVHEN